MARKPHNYAHFQNLVNELKEQNAGNIATLQTHLEIQTDVLQSMKGFMLKGLQADQADLRKDREKELEEKKEKNKGLTMKSKMNLPRFSGKGFMGMLGNFLSTALMGIPGGLRRFMPASLGMALLPKLARGIALLVAGPSLIKALQEGFDQDTFSGGVEAFINSYFSASGGPYKTLANAAAGGAGKGALIGFGLLGPRGAIIGGLLGGSLTSLNHIFSKGSGKVDSKGVMDKMKKYLLDNVAMFAGATGALIGMKALWPLGPAGMIAGGILGAGIGVIGAGTIKEMMAVEKAGEKDVGQQFRKGLKAYLISDEFKAVEDLVPYAGGLFGAAAFAGFGPAGMLAGMILGAGAGILGGPVLADALRAQGTEGGALSGHMKTALWEYLKKSPYLRNAMIGAGLFGGAALLGLGPLGLVAGIFVGGVVGIIATWITETLGDLAGSQFRDKFGGKASAKKMAQSLGVGKKQLEELQKNEQTLMKTSKSKHFSKANIIASAHGKQSYWGKRRAELYKNYLMEHNSALLGSPNYDPNQAGLGEFDYMAAVRASGKTKTSWLMKDSAKDNQIERLALQMMHAESERKRLERELQSIVQGGGPGLVQTDASSQIVNINQSVNQSTDYQNMDNGLYDGPPR